MTTRTLFGNDWAQTVTRRRWAPVAVMAHRIHAYKYAHRAWENATR